MDLDRELCGLLAMFGYVAIALPRVGGFGPDLLVGWFNRLLVVSYRVWQVTRGQFGPARRLSALDRNFGHVFGYNFEVMGDISRGGSIPSRFAWLWLTLGAGLAPFMGAQTMLPLAAWLGPIFLLRFTRTQRPFIGLPVVGLVMFVAWLIAFRGGFMPQGFSPVLTCAGIGVASALVYAIDRLLWRRLSGVAQTLVFPLASTVVSFLATFGNPVGTSGVEACRFSEPRDPFLTSFSKPFPLPD